MEINNLTLEPSFGIFAIWKSSIVKKTKNRRKLRLIAIERAENSMWFGNPKGDFKTKKPSKTEKNEKNMALVCYFFIFLRFSNFFSF